MTILVVREANSDEEPRSFIMFPALEQCQPINPRSLRAEEQLEMALMTLEEISGYVPTAPCLLSKCWMTEGKRVRREGAQEDAGSTHDCLGSLWAALH